MWFSASPPLIVSNLPQEEDGIQEILSILITPSSTEDDLHRILTILWYIWKARNDTRFKNKKWSVLQIHHAVAVDIKLATMNDDTNSPFVKATGQNGQNDAFENNCPTQGGNTISIQVINSSFAGGSEERRTPSENNRPTQRGHTISIQGISSSVPGEKEERTPNADLHCPTTLMNLPGPPHYKVLLLALLPGARCYTDASTTPDDSLQVSKLAGLGILFFNNLQDAASTIYIKIKQKGCSSVVMAEAAALAIGAQ